MTSPLHNSYLFFLKEVTAALSRDIMAETLALACTFCLEEFTISAGLARFALNNVFYIHVIVLLFYIYFIITDKPDNCLSYLRNYL
jgi:hypothetical protein